MIAAWMLHATWIAALLAGAAALVERGLRLRGKAVRGVWAGALLGSLLLPAAALLTGGGVPADAGEARLEAPVATAAPAEEREDPAALAARALTAVRGLLDGAGELTWRAQEEVRRAAAAPGIQEGLVGAWALLAIVLGALLFRSVRRLGRERRTWPRRELRGVPVRVSPDRGPGVVGLLRGEIVVPSWVLELDGKLQRMICLHEREHLRAGDHRLFAVGLLAALLVPWNLPLWWQLRRLRLAIECDCDRRVLRRGIPPRGYANLLLRMGSRLSGLPLVAASFAEHKSDLEKRIRTMTSINDKHGWTGVTGAFLLGAGLVVLSCEAPPPGAGEEAVGPTEPLTAEMSDAGQEVEGDDRPMFRPYDVPPRLENPDDVVEALRAAYPAELREAGIGGRVMLFLKVDTVGAVEQVRVREGSGRRELDEAAMDVARAMRFSPALNRDLPTPVWVAQPVTFQPPAKDGQTLRVSGDGALAEGAAPNGEPLIVVDGVVRGRADLRSGDAPERLRGVLDGLGPEDIESIEILKGEAAEATYGERGRDGVVHITTKEGRGGG